MTRTPQNFMKRWVIPASTSPVQTGFLGKFSPLFQQILYNRGIATDDTAMSFLYPDLKTTHNPFQLTGMMSAVNRIIAAIQKDEPITIFGDYDVDGVTATALLVEAIQGQGGIVTMKIPDRFEEGYGLNKKALEDIHTSGVKLVISVDCGIRSIDEALFCKQIGLDLIITDHHQPLDILPEALAVINPKQPNDEYPFKELAGVGVAYKLAQGLFSSLGAPENIVERWLDLVALGTVADMAPLLGENRILVKLGLEQLRAGKRCGIFDLSSVAGINPSTISASDIGFKLGPRLNAAGRLESAVNSYGLLVSRDQDESKRLANELNKQNTQRQEQTRSTQEKAIATIESTPDEFILIVIDPDFNEGIVGLAASRLVEQYHRPAIVGVRNEENTRCSCRSIADFHITRALDECKDLLIRHGGHAAAAGFTVSNDNLESLLTRLKQIAERELSNKDLTPVMTADAVVDFNQINPREMFTFLDQLQPVGYGNPEVVLCSKGITVTQKRSIGSDNRHLKLIVTDGWQTYDCIAFGFGYLAVENFNKVDILYTYELNNFNGRSNPQLNIKDIHLIQ